MSTEITFKIRAMDEIERREWNDERRKEDKKPATDLAMMRLSNAELREIAGVETPGKARKSKETSSPKKDKRVIEMTEEQRAERDRLYATTGGGIEYAKECLLAGIPVRMSTLKRHGLLVKV